MIEFFVALCNAVMLWFSMEVSLVSLPEIDPAPVVAEQPAPAEPMQPPAAVEPAPAPVQQPPGPSEGSPYIDSGEGQYTEPLPEDQVWQDMHNACLEWQSGVGLTGDPALDAQMIDSCWVNGWLP